MDILIVVVLVLVSSFVVGRQLWRAAVARESTDPRAGCEECSGCACEGECRPQSLQTPARHSSPGDPLPRA